MAFPPSPNSNHKTPLRKFSYRRTEKKTVPLSAPRKPRRQKHRDDKQKDPAAGLRVLLLVQQPFQPLQVVSC